MSEFKGKVVLITGAGLGYGRALAEVFVSESARVIANDLTPINLDDTASRIQNRGEHLETYVADISSKLALQTMIEAILDEYGRIDFLINTTSVSPSDALLAMDEWDWRRTLDLNLTGPFLLMQSVGRVMQAQGGGVIINLITWDGQSAAACAGKNGLMGLTRAAAAEFGASDIRVNAVCKGLGEAERMPDFPDDPVALVTFLCSQKAAGIHGRVLHL